ncbi:hypothetical protein FGG08_003081 [Glutinoglossum americanum]|uniref:Leucine rich repeat domain-containing protein n=1 Tax=Glutinoglossum americanum TaxID=1670608 RepID=A0A9P8I824_9PEZI|nr:hypothetical protein FGG08_003081 [Glutinoglossum americanum]
MKSAKLSLTPHHLFYILSRFEELNIPVGPMNVRLENLDSDSSPANYVSFLSQSQRSRGKNSDRDSIRSVSSVRSVMSGMSSLWSSFGLGSSNSAAKTERAKAAIQADLKYLYSAFTKIPCLRLAPDRKARLIEGYEEFPFDTAVPLLAFKNVSALEISDIDVRQFYGWDRMADQLRSLSVKRAGVEDLSDLLVSLVLDDMDRRRRRSSKAQSSPVLSWSAPSPTLHQPELPRSNSAPSSPKASDKLGSSSPNLQSTAMVRGGSEGSKASRPRSISPSTKPRVGSSHGLRGSGHRVKRSGSGSSHSSSRSTVIHQSGSSSNLLIMGPLPPSKWRFLKHLGLPDNSLTFMTAASLAPLADTLHSLDLSSNLFTQVPDCLATLTSLRALNLSNCMIDSLHSLSRNPLPAITALNLRGNRLTSIAGIERLPSIERLDIRDNKLTDPTEIARLTGAPEIREIWVTGNPFTRTHGGYRVTIFNLFRTSPGYSEDIVIDSTGPGYSERRQLVDRIEEPPTVPVVKPPLQPYMAIPSTNTSIAAAPPVEGTRDRSEPTERSLPHTVQNEVNTGSVGKGRRKGTRRRIVELTRSDSPPTPPADPTSNIRHISPTNAGAEVYEVIPGDPLPRAQRVPSQRQRLPSQLSPPPRIDTTMAAPSIQTSYATPTNQHTSKEIQDWNTNGEIYRKKIEALRNEVGNARWLSVLSEEGWDNHRGSQTISPGPEFSPASTIKPSPTTPRANSQPIVSGSRTLG